MIILYAMFTTLCLCIGFYFGFILGSTKELPNIRRDREERKQKIKEDKESLRFNKILGNLSRYDGTDKGQEDIE